MNRILTTILFLSFVLLLQAQIKVASVLGDNMVLQRNNEVKIWGTALPNDKLVISTDWDKSKISTVSNEKGEWLVKVKTTEAGGPYTVGRSVALLRSVEHGIANVGKYLHSGEWLQRSNFQCR